MVRGKKKGRVDAGTRFGMVKARHTKTLLDALAGGEVDRQLIPFYRKIMESRNYFTSSGCAGRILLLGLGSSGRKDEAYFHAKWHRKVSAKEVAEALEKPSRGSVWFKMESLILHIGCAGLKRAEAVLAAMRETGIKRGGIMVAKPGKFVVEVVGTQEMTLPAKEGDEILVSAAYLKKIVESANRKLEKNYETIKKFERNFAKEL